MDYIDFIDAYDFGIAPHSVTYDFGWGARFSSIKNRRYWKREGGRRLRRYFRDVARGGKPRNYRPVSGWDIN